MKMSVFDLTGKQKEEVNLMQDIFAAKINEPLMAQAVRVYLANQRTSSAKTLTRSQIDRTSKKMYRQKGTGNARHGSAKAAIYVGGFKAHGPRIEHHYKLDLPKKMRVVALKSALSLQAQQHHLLGLSGSLEIKTPKTKTMSIWLKTVLTEKSRKATAMIVTEEMAALIKSLRNIPKVTCLLVDNLTTYQVLKHHSLIFTVEALKALELRLGASKNKKAKK